MDLTLLEIATLVDGRLAGDGDRRVHRVASLEAAGPDDITFMVDGKLLPKLEASAAGCAIVPDDTEVPDRDVVHHPNPYAAVARLLEAAYPEEVPAPGVSELAVVHATAKLGDGVSVAAFAAVERDCVLEDGVRLGVGVSVGAECRLGAGTVLHPRVVLYPRTIVGRGCIIHAGAVLGSDGFGFARDTGEHRKIPQIGGVVVADDVEIGANTCIDRGTLEATTIGRNTKIDNLVQIGHNCVIGERVLLCGQVGLAGSAVLGDDVVLAGQVGVADHVTIGSGSMAGAQTAVLSDVPAGSQVCGVPQLPIEQWRKASVAFRTLPSLRADVRRLRKQLEALEQRLGESAAD